VAADNYYGQVSPGPILGGSEKKLLGQMGGGLIGGRAKSKPGEIGGGNQSGRGFGGKLFFICPGSSIPDLGHSVGHCHFRILTQRVIFETSDATNI